MADDATEYEVPTGRALPPGCEEIEEGERRRREERSLGTMRARFAESRPTEHLSHRSLRDNTE